MPWEFKRFSSVIGFSLSSLFVSFAMLWKNSHMFSWLTSGSASVACYIASVSFVVTFFLRRSPYLLQYYGVGGVASFLRVRQSL